jgi:hypothetical protein
VCEALAIGQPFGLLIFPDAQSVDPFQLLLVGLAGWINQQQRDVIDYLQEETRVLRQQLGNKRLCL